MDVSLAGGMMRYMILLSFEFLGAVSGCAAAPTVQPQAVAQMADPRTGKWTTTKPFEHPDCIAARDRARVTTFLPSDTSFFTFPQPLTIFVPPVPFPTQIRDFPVEIDFRVDSAGSAIMSRTRIGAIGYGYDRKFRSAIEKTRFRPAVLDGCSVEGNYTLTVTLNATSARVRRLEQSTSPLHYRRY